MQDRHFAGIVILLGIALACVSCRGSAPVTETASPAARQPANAMSSVSDAPAAGTTATGVPAPAARPTTPPATPSPTTRATRAPAASGPGTTTGAPEARAPRPASKKRALMRAFTGIGQLDKAGKLPLTPAQAKAILAVMGPLRTQGTLTEDQAADALAAIDKALTPAQRDALAAQAERADERTRQAPPAGERPAPPDGTAPPPGRPVTGSPRQNMGAWAEMNPFAVKADNPMAARMAERWAPIYTALEQKAATK